MPNATFELARELLAQDEFEKAFEVLRPLLRGEWKDELIIQEGRFAEAKKPYTEGRIGFEKFQESTANIRYALLALLQRIENQPQITNHKSPASRHFTKVPLPGYVVGRDAFLKKLHDALTTQGDAALVQGLGGIGKTTIALAYAHHPEYAVTYDHIVYVEISGTLPDAFNGHPELAKRLGAEADVQNLLTQNNADGACCALLDALGRLSGHNLLVLDNANDREEMRRWKPELRRANCRLLVTSRANIPNLAHLPVEELDMADAQTLFAHHYGPVADADREPLAALLDMVERHTLLTEMLGKIGKQARYTVAELHDYVQNGFIRDARLQRRVETGALTERKGLDEATLLDLTRFLFGGIAPGLSERERDYLRWLAILPPRAFAPDLLARLFQIPDTKRPQWEADMDDLEKKGVPLHRGRDYGLHRVMREVILETEKCTVETCEPVILGVKDEIWIEAETQNPIEKMRNRDLAESILGNITDHSHSSMAWLKKHLGWVYVQLGLYEKAREIQEMVLAFEEKNNEENSEEISVTYSHLGIVYGQLGEYEKSRDMLEKALAADLHNYGEEHSETANSRSNLAVAYWRLSNYDLARDLIEKALQSELKKFGKDHPNISIRQSILALIYRDMSDYTRARGLFEAALISDLKKFGDEHPKVALRQNNLALTLKDLGENDAAIQLMQKAHATRLKLLGSDHPYTKDSAQALRDWGVEPEAS